MMSDSDARPVIVLSAINVFSAGPLSIVRDFLAALLDQNRKNGMRWRVILLAHRRSLYDDLGRDFEILEFPKGRRTWFHRLYYEYGYFRLWSRQRNIDAWLSLHDLTPSVSARRRAVYCHHATPFYDGPRSRVSREWRFAIQRRLYSWFYSINLRENDCVIVQQQWLRRAFVDRFALDPSRIIVARPSIESPDSAPGARNAGGTLLVYPAFPRFFKNVEILLQAIESLPDLDLRLVLTFKGNENAYARAMFRRARGLPRVEFRGVLSRQETFALYEACDALVFPSRLESFGLPLMEVQGFRKPVFAAGLPYAREALSGYDLAVFFDPDDARGLTVMLRDFCRRRRFDAQPSAVDYDPPYAASWRELIALLTAKRILP